MLPSGFYNMDCLEAMREFPDKFFDLSIVDVPCGIGEDGRKSQSRMEKFRKGGGRHCLTLEL